VADGMRSISQDREVDAFVTTGDNLYVDDLDLAWRRPYGWLLDRGIPVWAAFGNHDIESEERRQNAESLFGVDHYRSHRWGQVLLLFLDANHPEDPAQLEWLNAQLEGAEEETVVVVFHQPAVSCSNHGPTPLVVDLWMDRFEAADVDLVLQGHDHNYQHHLVEGIDYVVTGGGGKGLYELEPCADGSSPLAAAVEHHFLVLEQAGGLISVSAIRPDGSAIDLFDVNP
jgi:predicted phosphodiesterase